jgi:hypothetical protein
MNMNYANPTFRHLNGESRQDSYLQAISPTKRMKVLDQNILKNEIQSNTTSSLKKPWITSSLDSLSNDIKKATESNDIKKATENDKSSKKEMKSKPKKVVKFAPVKATLILPESNKKNNNAAIQIQRIARGGWQRLMFRIVVLQHKLDTKDQITNMQLQQIKERTQQRKETFRRKLELKSKSEDKKVSQESSLVKESKDVIAYLRKENQKFRQKNEKLYKNIKALNRESERLENANKLTDEHFASLNDHAKEIEETNAKLTTIVPMYEASVTRTREAVETRQQFGESEHTIRLAYVKTMATVMTMVEEGCKDLDLVDEIVGYCVDLEGKENTLPLPPKLEQFVEDELDKSASSDEDHHDGYIVAALK